MVYMASFPNCLVLTLGLAYLSAPAFAIVGGQEMTVAILTAASCVDQSCASALTVHYVGVDRTKLLHSNSVTSIVLSPEWNSGTLDSDYAVLQCHDEFVSISDSGVAGQALLSTSAASTHNGTAAKIMGWGKSSGSSNNMPTALHEAHMIIWDQGTCKAQWSDKHKITDNMACVASEVSSACNGDSGDPVTDASGLYLLGLLSLGAPGCPQDSTV
ncbi:trypsin-like protease [Penicillium angulare]|uniref:trypsin-like protease n=1 Tax=Penicillium angulare TaxID=116970 RepID=UPI0025417637|nr:trypsin-like protease [Penicillium angulare]KAJ5261424.1 trypsin-like protease [Penicillium angulare]